MKEKMYRFYIIDGYTKNGKRKTVTLYRVKAYGLAQALYNMIHYHHDDIMALFNNRIFVSWRKLNGMNYHVIECDKVRSTLINAYNAYNFDTWNTRIESWLINYSFLGGTRA